MKEAIMDSVELYYINNISKPGRQTGVRWSKEIRDQIAAERKIRRFLDDMNIVIFKLVIKCLNRRSKK